MTASREPGIGRVDLYWIPLGAGAHVVRSCGKLYEALSAFVHRRPRRDLYHAALEVRVPEGRFVIEMAPGPDLSATRRHAVVEGPVGLRWLGRFRLFRYEVRCERGGSIPDVDAAVSVLRVSDRVEIGRRVIASVPEVPTLVWGRDEAGTGDMWSCNSVVSWLLTRAGVDTTSISPPVGGRAPGWRAGRVVAGSTRPVPAEELAELARPEDGARQPGAQEPVARAEWCGTEGVLEQRYVHDCELQQH